MDTPDMDAINGLLEKMSVIEADLMSKLKTSRINEEKTLWSNTYYKAITELLVTEREFQLQRGVSAIDVSGRAEKLANEAVSSYRKMFGEP